MPLVPAELATDSAILDFNGYLFMRSATAIWKTLKGPLHLPEAAYRSASH
jgi:hypothetical protein